MHKLTKLFSVEMKKANVKRITQQTNANLKFALNIKMSVKMGSRSLVLVNHQLTETSWRSFFRGHLILSPNYRMAVTVGKVDWDKVD